MGTLVEFRGWLRSDLNDPVGGTQRFSDGDLDRAVSRAVAEVTLVWPRVSDVEVVLAAGGRTVPLAAGSFPGLLGVDEVEWPYGVGGSEAAYPVRRRAAGTRTGGLRCHSGGWRRCLTIRFWQSGSIPHRTTQPTSG